MLQRVKRMIRREKLKSPGTPVAFLILKRFGRVINNKVQNAKMFIIKDSTFRSQDDLWMCSLFPKKVLDLVIAELKPASVLDIGCGTGQSLKYFLKQGIMGQGVENSKIAIKQSLIRKNILRHNLKKELDLKQVFDLVWCFEVIEHIHPKYEAKILKTLTNHSSVIILSAAHPGQGGHGHFNEQNPDYWIQRFNDLEYLLDGAFTDKLKGTGETHAENLLCFRKKT